MKAFIGICTFQVITIAIMFWAHTWWLSAFIVLNCNTMLQVWSLRRANLELGL